MSDSQAAQGRRPSRQGACPRGLGRCPFLARGMWCRKRCWEEGDWEDASAPRILPVSERTAWNPDPARIHGTGPGGEGRLGRQLAFSLRCGRSESVRGSTRGFLSEGAFRTGPGRTVIARGTRMKRAGPRPFDAKDMEPARVHLPLTTSTPHVQWDGPTQASALRPSGLPRTDRERGFAWHGPRRTSAGTTWTVRGNTRIQGTKVHTRDRMLGEFGGNEIPHARQAAPREELRMGGTSTNRENIIHGTDACCRKGHHPRNVGMDPRWEAALGMRDICPSREKPAHGSTPSDG